MDNQTIIITGSSGFIGGELVTHFLAKKYKVFSLSRSEPVHIDEGSVFFKYNLTDDKIDDKIFSKADVIIHCAYSQYSDSNIDADEINYEGTKRLLALSRKYSCKKFIFLSSFSAHNDAVSHYGRSKLKTEMLFDSEKDLIIKPGLVLGDGGLFKSLKKIILKNKFIPLIGGGMQSLQTVNISQLIEVIETGIKNNISGNYTLAEQNPVSALEFYKAISKGLDKKSVFIPFPYGLAICLVSFLKFLKIKSPITKENILGLNQSKFYDISKTIQVFGITPISYKESLKKLLK